MSTLRDFLDEINADDFAVKLAEADASNGAKTAMDGTENQPMPGEATAASPVAAPAPPAQGAVEAGATKAPELARSTAPVEMNKREQLIDMAMNATGGQQAAADEANRGLGTDEGHNAGINPSTGQQQYQNLAAPQDAPFQDPYQRMVQDGGGMQAAASAGTPKQDVTPEPTDETKTAEERKFAEQVAEDCIAQGLFIERGIRHGLAKSAESGELASVLAPSVLVSHEAAYEKLAESAAVDAFTTKVAEQIWAKLQAKANANGQ